MKEKALTIGSYWMRMILLGPLMFVLLAATARAVEFFTVTKAGERTADAILSLMWLRCIAISVVVGMFILLILRPIYAARLRDVGLTKGAMQAALFQAFLVTLFYAVIVPSIHLESNICRADVYHNYGEENSSAPGYEYAMEACSRVAIAMGETERGSKVAAWLLLPFLLPIVFIGLLPSKEITRNQEESAPDTADDIHKLGEMYQQGLLSEEEFTEAKKQILNRAA